MVLPRIFRKLRDFLASRDLKRALDRHRRAAEGLDAAVREMLSR